MSTPLRQVGRGTAAASAEPRIQRYRQAERALWSYYGLEPTERFIQVDSPAVLLHVLETGSGEPLLFVHGSAAGGPIWAPLVRELRDFRCLVIDRPGWGLSSTVDYSKHEYKTVVSDMLVGVLNGLGVDRAHVIGGSIGNVWVLRLAAAHAPRAGRVALMGGGPLLDDVPVPPNIRLMASPIGALMLRLPVKPDRERSILREIGHNVSVEAGRMDEFIKWRVALARDTESIRNERSMMRAVLSWRRGAYRPGLTFKDEELAGIKQSVFHVYGTADPVGTVDIWRRFTGLLPKGELRLVDEGGHLVWFDDPRGVARDVSRFVRDGENTVRKG
jgi:4,5:9,10-diseco-3-hydroxy-5,9,17-trioxoandrosta-1(10),2-diene-4-oate hydrolase